MRNRYSKSNPKNGRNNNGDNREFEENISHFLNKNIKYIITSSEDETVKIWNKSMKVEYEEEIRRVEFS